MFAMMLATQVAPVREKPSLRWADNRARYKALLTGKPMTVTEIAYALGQTRDGTRATLSRMARRGDVVVHTKGVVTHKGRTPDYYVWADD